MDEQQLAGRRLVELAEPYLLRNDKDGLAELLRGAWSEESLTLLLAVDDVKVVDTAATCLGLIGTMPPPPALAELLHHPDERVAADAEDALWSIWFRDGGPMAQAVLTRIARNIKAGETENVVPMLTELIRTFPTYAEAYHQRSQARYLENSYEFSLRDARRAFELNPHHFGALANQAHALLALGREHEALKIYRQVLQLHPRMEGIRKTLNQLRQRFVLVGA